MKRSCYALFVCCLLLLAVRPAAAEPVIYIEPLTGSRITLPEDFSSSTDTRKISGQYGMIQLWIKDRMVDSASVQVDVSVNEVLAKSIYDVLNKMLFDPKDCRNYEILELSANHITVDEIGQSFGEKEYRRHWAWLLEDGSYLYVVLKTNSEERKRYRDAVSIEFGAEKGEESLSLMTAFPAPNKEKEPRAGKWRNERTGMLLDVYGPALLNFRDAEGNPSAYGFHDTFWEKTTLWSKGKDSRQCGMETQDPDTIVISNSEGLDGEYVRLAEEPGASAELPAPTGNENLRGEWENDTEFCTMLITRASVNIQTGRSSSMISGYDKTPDGLDLKGGVHIRRTNNGGLTMDGYKGVFYRVGLGKGVDRFAAFKPYNGSWENGKARISMTIQDGGIGYSRGDSVGAGACSVDEDGYLRALNSRGRIDPKSGNLIFDGIEGEFIRQGAEEKNKTESGAASESEKPACAATLYEHADYYGESQCLVPGRYDVEQLVDGGIGNDTLSSLKVAPGHTVTLYEHSKYQGDEITVTDDTPYIGDAWNDRVSSVIVEKQ